MRPNGRSRQPATVRLDDRAADRQAQSNAVGLGGVERFEYPLSFLGSNPASGILDADQYPLIEPLRTNNKRVGASLDRGHRVDCVGNEVDKNLVGLHED